MSFKLQSPIYTNYLYIYKFRCYMHKSRVRNIQNFCSRSIEAPNPSRGGHAFQSTTRALHRESSVNKPVSIPKPDNSRDNSPLLSPFVYMMYIYIHVEHRRKEREDLFRRSSVLYQAGIMPPPIAVFSDDLVRSRIGKEATLRPLFASRKKNLFR